MDILNSYLDHIKSRKGENTYLNKKYILEPFVEWLNKSGNNLRDCTEDEILDYLEERDDLTNSTRRHVLGTIKTCFRWYSARIRKFNKGVKNFDYPLEDERVKLIMQADTPISIKYDETEKKGSLTLDDFKKLLDGASYHDSIKMFLLGYFGVRASEFLSISPSIVNWNRGEIKVGTKTKAARRTLYFDKYAGKILAIYLNNRISYRQELNTMLDRYKSKIKTRCHPHAFRRLFNTEMQKTIDREKYPYYQIVVKKFMGHAGKGDMTELYTEIGRDELRQIWLNYHYLNGEDLIKLPK